MTNIANVSGGMAEPEVVVDLTELVKLKNEDAEVR